MKVVDLFCGGGGFSLGAHAAGFDIACAIDIDPILTSSFTTNFPSTKLMLADVASLSGAALSGIAGGQIEGLIGGPPCQGFSLMGHRAEDDPRRQLVDHFFRLVSEIMPTFFVMENVVGLMQGDALPVLEAAMSRIPSDYAVIGPTVLDAADFGVPTNRKRCFVIGVLKDRANIPSLCAPATVSRTTVADAISDLRYVRDLGMLGGFDSFEILDDANPSPYAKALRSADRRSTGNLRTVHTEAVAKRFAAVQPGKTDLVGRHQRLAWGGLCPTLRAGTGADRGSYQSVRPLHPDEARVITVREAARLQGFPDHHRFHPTIWHSFRMIGNSVAPPVATAVLSSVARACGHVSPAQVAAE